MSTIQQQIAGKFVSKLAESDDIDVTTIEKLRILFSGNKRIKPEDLIKIFTLPPGEDLK